MPHRIPYDALPVLLGPGSDAKVTAWLVPGRGYYNDDPANPHGIQPFLAYDLMGSGEVAESEVHQLVSDLFNYGLGDGAGDRLEVRLRELGFDDAAIGRMVDDPDAVLYDHMAAQGCVAVWAPADASRTDYAAEVVGSPEVLDAHAREGIALNLAATGGFGDGDRVRFTTPAGDCLGVVEIHHR